MDQLAPLGTEGSQVGEFAFHLVPVNHDARPVSSSGRAAVLQSNGVQRYPSAQPDRGGRGLRSLNIELQNALNRPGEVGIEPVDLLR